MPRFDADPLDFTQPSVQTISRAMALQKAWFSPQFVGLENIDPARPALYVGNHTLFGGLDAPLMVSGLYEQTGVYLRSLADRAHFYVPGWRDVLVKFGSVVGTRENCAALMRSGQSILVYPGGSREVMKNKGESYRLLWKDRTGFAAMAMEHGYDIIPFAAIGAEEAFSIHYDANDFRASRLGQALTQTGLMGKYLRNGDAFNPLVTGVGKTLLPRPEKQYFSFGKPIATIPWLGRHTDKEAQYEVRTQVELQVYAQMESLFALREQDTDWSWWRRKLTGRSIPAV